MKIIAIIYGLIVIYLYCGVYIWEHIDKKTRYQNINDEYLKLPIILGSFFSYLFIKSIRKKRKSQAIRMMINDIHIKIMFLGFDGLKEQDKNRYIMYNRILKIDKIKSKI